MVKTISTEFNLVCDSSWKVNIVTILYGVGYIIGALFFGILSDRRGRKFGMIITVIGAFVSQIIVALSFNFWLFLSTRLVVGIFVGGCYVVTFSQSLKYCDSCNFYN